MIARLLELMQIVLLLAGQTQQPVDIAVKQQ